MVGLFAEVLGTHTISIVKSVTAPGTSRSALGVLRSGRLVGINLTNYFRTDSFERNSFIFIEDNLIHSFYGATVYSNIK